MKQRHNKLLNGQHLTLSQQTDLLSEFVISIDGIPQILNTITDIPGAWVGAGVIFQNVWNVMHDYEINSHIKDIDILYWDESDLSWGTENCYIQALNDSLDDIPIPIDAKNIARIHLWYEKRFGIPKTPYGSVQESVASWPVVGACIAMRHNGNSIEFIAPYGFQDMFTLRLRPNKVLVNRAIYEAKAMRWKQQWPLLSVDSW